MTREKFEELMKGSSNLSSFNGYCNVFLGLKIITKYLPKVGIEAAEHDIIYSAGVDELLEAGITEEDVTELQKLNWMIDEFEEGLACFV